MIETTLKSQIVADVTVETHNDYKAFILRQRTVGNEERPSVEHCIVMTAEQFRQLASLIPLPDLETSGYDCVDKEKK